MGEGMELFERAGAALQKLDGYQWTNTTELEVVEKSDHSSDSWQ